MGAYRQFGLTVMQLLAGVGAAEVGSFEPIATTVVSTAVSSVTFSSIPQTYKHLQIRILGRTTRVSTEATICIKLNGDGGSNWSTHQVSGDGSVTSSSGGANRTHDFTQVCQGTGSSATANIFGVGIVDILDYANTNKYKTIRVLTGKDLNGSSGSIVLASSNWRNTNAITTILFEDSSFNNLASYTSIALYGIAG